MKESKPKDYSNGLIGALVSYIGDLYFSKDKQAKK